MPDRRRTEFSKKKSTAIVQKPMCCAFLLYAQGYSLAFAVEPVLVKGQRIQMVEEVHILHVDVFRNLDTC